MNKNSMISSRFVWESIKTKSWNWENNYNVLSYKDCVCLLISDKCIRWKGTNICTNIFWLEASQFLSNWETMTLEEFSCSRLYKSEACRGRWAPSLTRGENHRNESLENTEAEASGLGLCANKTFCTWNQGNMTWQGNQGNMLRGPKLLPWASVQTKYSALETVHVLTYRGCWAPSFSSRENQRNNMSHKKTKGKASALGLCANKTSHRPTV